MKLESRKGTPAGALVTPLFWSGGYVPATPGRWSRPGVFLRESIRGGGGLKATTRPGSGSTRKPHQCQRRKVELTKAAIVALRRHRTRQLEERFAAVGGWEELDLVFANEVGRPTTADRLRWNFQRTLVRANLPRIRFHDLRHTAATLLLGRGVHPKIVSEMLGHSTIAITLDLYSHVIPTMQQDAAAAFDLVIGTKA